MDVEGVNIEMKRNAMEDISREDIAGHFQTLESALETAKSHGDRAEAQLDRAKAEIDRLRSAIVSVQRLAITLDENLQVSSGATMNKSVASATLHLLEASLESALGVD